jgi:hypothetical protein
MYSKSTKSRSMRVTEALANLTSPHYSLIINGMQDDLGIGSPSASLRSFAVRCEGLMRSRDRDEMERARAV